MPIVYYYIQVMQTLAASLSISYISALMINPSLVHTHECNWLAEMGIRVLATFLNEQVSVYLTCLLDQCCRNLGDHTSLIQKLFFKLSLTAVLQYCQERGSGDQLIDLE